MKNLSLLFIVLFTAMLLTVYCGAKKTAEETAEPVQAEGQQTDPPGQIRAAHILLMYQGSLKAPETVTRTKSEAKAEIEALLEKVRQGADFAELAKLYSDCPSKRNGGDLNYFGRGVMAKPFEDAAFSLEKGEVSDVVETQFGFHIIKRL